MTINNQIGRDVRNTLNDIETIKTIAEEAKLVSGQAKKAVENVDESVERANIAAENANNSIQLVEDIITELEGVDAVQFDNRLKEQSAQLAQKATQAELIGKRDKSVEIGMSDLSQEVREGMTGGSVAVVGVDSVGETNVKNQAITLRKLSDSLAEPILRANSKVVEFRDFHDISALNGATSNGSTLVIPAGSTGHNSHIRFTKLGFVADANKEIKTVSIVKRNTLESVSYKEQLVLRRASGSLAAVTAKNVKIEALNSTDTLITATFDILKGDHEIRIGVQVASKVATQGAETQINVTSSFIAEDSNLILEGLIKDVNTLKPTSSALFSGSSTTVTREMTGDAFFEITKNFNNTVRVYGVKGSKEHLLSLTNLSTGTTSSYAVYCARYKVNKEGFTTLKFVRFSSDNDVFIPTISLLTTANETPIQVKGRSTKNFLQSRVENQVISPSGKAIFGVRQGKLLAFVQQDSNTLRLQESDETYGAWNDRGTISGESQLPKYVEVAGDGSVIIVCTSGRVMRTTDLQTFTQVLDVSAHAGYTGQPSSAYVYIFGGFTQLDAHDNILLFCEYNQSKHYPTEEGGKIYMSTNYGQTFQTIFDLKVNFQMNDSTHMHAVKYDPYEGIIWMVCGDSIGRQMIWYSMDLGQNWYMSTELDQSVLQMTSIIPMKNCVLFGTDGKLVGVARYNRPESGTLAGNKMHFDVPLIFKEGWNKGQSLSMPLGSRAYIDYEKNIAYFSFLSSTNVHADNPEGILNYGQIYATDGYDFYEVFKHNEVVPNGVIAVYGDPQKQLAFGKLGLSGMFVKINTDTWN